MGVIPIEIWANIFGYNGKYEISTWGRVFNTVTGKYMIPQETEKGYLRVDLYDFEGVRKHHKIHRLVAQAFIANPENKPQINHKDGNKQNNSITNLEWVTDEENKAHRMTMKRRMTTWS